VSAPRLLILDADGTLRWTTVPGQPCPNAPGEWRLMPNVRETLAAFDWEETRLGVASNQNGVAHGYLTKAMAMRLLVDTVTAAAGFLPPRAIIEMCTCGPGAGCPCRKPAPGMLLRILAKTRIAPADALYVGDLAIDREAAERAGIPFRWAGDFFGWPAEGFPRALDAR
jgi:D-glycero-D-manno-heptose 1,7-bisphosphate phosphatase